MRLSPFDLIELHKHGQEYKLRDMTSLGLTRDGICLLETSCDLWVHIDGQVGFFDELAVSSLDSLVDPLCKWLSDNRVDQVDQPLPWELLEVTGITQVLLQDWILLREGQYFFDAQPFILGAKDVFDIVAVDDYKIGYNILFNLHLREPSTKVLR